VTAAVAPAAREDGSAEVAPWRVRLAGDAGTVIVSVRNVAPTIIGIASTGEVVRGEPASPRVFATDSGNKDTVTGRWDFGDGSTGNGLIAEHSYTTTGRMW